MAYTVCPYYDARYNKCTLYGTLQGEYQKNTFCMTSDKWGKCPNYQVKKK